MRYKWLIVNRDGAGVGEVEAQTADDAIIYALGTFGFNDLDHAHPRFSDPKNCVHCRTIEEKHAKETKQ